MESRSYYALSVCLCLIFLCLPAARGEPSAVYFQEEAREEAAAPDGLMPPEPMIEAFDAAELEDEDEVADQCDEKKMKALNKKVAGAYKGLFFNNDFNYLCDPCYCDWHLGEHVKRMGLHDCCWVLDLGGQYRTRFHSENNMRGLGLTGVSDDFLLHRTRLYANLEMGRHFRAYVEYIDAVSNWEDNNPRPIEENRSDLLNAFGEVLLWDDCCSELRFRAGRQELLYGAQRAVSPLDWANTRRTFQGYKAMYSGHGWEVDGFWMNPVFPDTKNFDSPIDDEEFMGFYATNPDYCGKTVDLFYLRLLDRNPTGPFPEDFDFHTIGGRIKGKYNCYDYEFWGAYQFGENTDGSAHAAGAYTMGIGRQFECHCWKPTVWLYYDWASGGNDLGAGDGYHHLFPLAHKYLGFMDLFGRRNILSPNMLITAQPTDKLKLLLWYYYLRLQNINDTPYTVAMTPFNPGNAPGSADLGHEVDLLASYTIDVRQTLVFGYSHFFAGRYYSTTPGVPTNSDGNFFYAQYQLNF